MNERCKMRCANPDCDAEALYFRSGSLHWMNNPPRPDVSPARPETSLVWLCAECSKTLVVETWRPAGEQLRHNDGKTIPIDRDRRRPPAAAAPQHPVSQSA